MIPHTIKIVSGRIYVNGMFTPFLLKEFIPNNILNRFGEKSLWFLDPKIIFLAIAIRNHFNKAMIINTAQLQNRGFRSPNSIGAEFSQHKFGRAIDFNISGISSDEVFKEIITNEKMFINVGLTTLEDRSLTSTWTHADVRYTGLNNILIVR